MDIEIIEMADTKAKFVLKNSSPAMANALRRTLLSGHGERPQEDSPIGSSEDGDP